MHSLRYLGEQMRQFGPLNLTSAMWFESAHSFLENLATMSHDYCDIICRRYLQHQNLLQTETQHDDVSSLVYTWKDQELPPENDKVEFRKDLIETTHVVAVRSLYPEAVIESRSFFGKHFLLEKLLDSFCYRRNEKTTNVTFPS